MTKYEYDEVKWPSGKPRSGEPSCPKCESPIVTRLRQYPVDYTENYVDYECENCGEKFTVNWS